MRSLIFLFLTTGLTALAAPEISVRQAADIAEKEKLVREGGDQVYVESLTLQKVALAGTKWIWVAKWSAPLPANSAGKHEVGVEIFMDGTVKHLVKGAGDEGVRTLMH